jgi:hypothetical protein
MVTMYICQFRRCFLSPFYVGKSNLNKRWRTYDVENNKLMLNCPESIVVSRAEKDCVVSLVTNEMVTTGNGSY